MTLGQDISRPAMADPGTEIGVNHQGTKTQESGIGLNRQADAKTGFRYRQLQTAAKSP